jgi:hypothetical protein
VFTNDDPLNVTDPFGLVPSLGVTETDKQVAEVAVVFTEQEGDALEASAKALLTYINNSSQQLNLDATQLGSACALGADQSNCGSSLKVITTLTRKINSALEEVGPYAVNAVLLLKASLRVANSLPKWVDSTAVLKNSIGTDMQEEATVDNLTDLENLNEDFVGLFDGFNNFLNDDIGDL